MEHLVPNNAKPSSLIAIPYLAHEYDGSDFITYPERHGWDVSTWTWVEDEQDGFDQNGHSAEEMASFLQTWLFFGLLQSILLDIQVDQNDFKSPAANDGQYFLTTRSLSRYLAQRYKRLEGITMQERSEAQMILSDCRAMADAVTGGLNFTLFYGSRRRDTVALESSLLALRLLVELLWRLEIDHKTYGPRGELFYDLHLRQRMLEDGWCPFTVEFMQSKLPLQLQAYAFSLGTSRSGYDHGLCKVSEDPKGCTLLQVGASFTTRHAVPNCHCQQISSPIDEIVSVLRSGKIPVLAIKTDHESGDIELLVEGIDLEDVAYRMACPFIAFSHVWANGLGNPSGNSLWKCQIRRLGEVLGYLRNTDSLVEILSEHFETTAWVHDTIPFWLDTLCIPVSSEHQDLRDFSINKMRDIYRKAAGVVVLDPDLSNLPSSTNPLDVMVKALISSWNSRLWTYQEAALTHNLYIAVSGACFNLKSIDSTLAEEQPEEDPVQRQLTWSAKHLFSDLVHDSLAGFCTSENPTRALQRMLRAVSHRNTSRSGDETICLATFLNLNVVSLLALPEDERMPALLAQLTTVPPQLLFAHGKHINQKGFRWAPRSYLAPNGVQDSLEIAYPRTFVDEAGITQSVPMPSLHASGLGLSLFVSGLTFERTQPTSSNVFSIRTTGNGSYQCEIRDTGMSTSCLSSSMENLFVILLMDLEKCNLSILAETRPSRENQDTILCHWLGVVEILTDRDRAHWAAPEEDIAFDGQLVPHREWIVD